MSQAHEIENLINDKAGTRDLDDSDFDGSAGEGANEPIEISSDEEEGSPIPSPPPVKSAIARSTRKNTSHRAARGASGPDLIANLSRVFDPEVQKARDSERANRSLQNTHFLAQSQQLRDLQHSNERLHQQIADLQTRLQDVDRSRDRAELKLEMLQMPGFGMVRPASRRSELRHRRRMMGIPKKKHKCEETYPEGGGSTWWVTDEEDIASDESRDYDGHHNPVRVQQSPSPYQRKCNHFQHPSTPDPCHCHTVTCRGTSPFHSAMSGRNTTYVRAPGLNLTKSDLPVAGPSRSTMGLPTASVEGTGVELTISPQRGPPVSFVISPVRSQSSDPVMETQDQDEEPLTQWSATSRSPQP